MVFSSDLISQFVKVTKDEKKPVKETTVYGTVKEVDGSTYVKLDGSELLTPVTRTTNVKDGERVTVMIKNHNATVTGNLSSPSARTGDVEEVDGRVNAAYALINTLEANSIKAIEAEIERLQADKLDAHTAVITYATIETLDGVTATFTNLKSEYGDFKTVTTEKITALEGFFKDLDVDGNLTVESLEAKFANIDFSNVGMAAMKNFYAVSGIIKDATISDGTITGTLSGVTITGDLIQANTILADKLVVKGEDGLYYRLNTDGETVEAYQTDQNSINGNVITAKSITASKISVTDLVAFGATIGGFHITDNALYSGVKSSVDNTTRGIYQDSDGQIAVGDASNFIKYYKDANGAYKLAISASELVLASSNKNVQEAIDTLSDDATRAQTTADDALVTADNADTLIRQLSESISMLVTDGNGTSLMTQTEDGWTFSTSDIQTAVASAAESLDALTTELGDTNSVVEVLRQAVSDLGELSEYVKISTYNGEPCIELGESDSEFKLRITNTQIVFMEGSSVVAYINNQTLHIKKAVIEEELQQGKFVWKARSNGNLGLIWKGV